MTQNPAVQTNINTRRPATPTRPRPTVPDNFLANNPFIGKGNTDESVSLSPADVMAILNIMNDKTKSTNNINNNQGGTISDQVFTTCPAATLCVDRSR